MYVRNEILFCNTCILVDIIMIIRGMEGCMFYVHTARFYVYHVLYSMESEFH